jgi:hypothetical protein
MGEHTNEVLDRHDVGVQGFDIDSEAKNAHCIVGMNGTAMGVCLGNVEGLTYEQIDRRFAAAMLRFAIEAEADGDGEGYEVLDELLEGLNRKDSENDKRRTVQVR